MSSDGNSDLAHKYPAGAIADSPVPFSQENPDATTVHVPVTPIIDFTTMRPLSREAPIFSPRPVTASSSASNIAAMFQQLCVHTPAPLTPDRQHIANQAAETFIISLTPAGRGGDEASPLVASGTTLRSEASMGTMPTAPDLHQSSSYDSAADDDLRHCARCGESREYCHGHTPVVPNPTLDLPPRIPVWAPVPADGVARFNLSRVQATTLAVRLVDHLKQNHQDATEVPPVYDYGDEFAHIIAEGLGIPPAVAAEGLGVRRRGDQGQGRGQGAGPQPVPESRRPANSQPAQARRPARRPVLPVPAGFEHNRGPAYIPFCIQENGRKTPARYIWAHLDTPNPFVEGRLSLNGPTYHSEIHAAAVHDVDIPPPSITAKLLRLLHTDYMGHDRVDEALGEIGDRSLTAEVHRYRRLEKKRRSFQESITRLEDQLFMADVERRMCVSRLESARAIARIQGEMSRDTQAFRLSLWSVECGRLP
jgi:hypothetical protein